MFSSVVYGLHWSAEVNALPGLQHTDSGDKVSQQPSLLPVVSQENLIQ